MVGPIRMVLTGIELSNPATPWITLVLVIAGWVAAYLFVAAGSRS